MAVNITHIHLPMKTSLKSCLSAVVIATAAVAVAASVAAAPSGKPGRQPALNRAKVAVTAKKLGLTADQKGSFKNIRKQTAGAVRVTRENSSLTRQGKRAQIGETVKAARKEMRAELTPEQRSELARIEHHPGLLNALAAHRARMGVVARRIDLSDDQQAQIRGVLSRTADTVKSLRTDDNLSPEEKKAKVHEQLQTSRGEVLNVLTPGQQTEAKEILKRLRMRDGSGG